MKSKLIKIIFAIVCTFFMIPSIIYIFYNKTILGFNIYYNFFLTAQISKKVSTTIYIILFILISILYLKAIKEKDIFKNINELINMYL